MLMQRLQHEPVAAQCDDDIRLSGRGGAILRGQAGERRLGLGHFGRHEGDLVETHRLHLLLLALA